MDKLLSYLKEDLDSEKQINDIGRIVITVLFALFCISTFTLIVYKTYNQFSIIDKSYDGWKITMYEMFEFGYGETGKLCFQIWCIISSLLGVLFVWLNKPKNAMIASFLNIGLMLMTFVKGYDYAVGNFWAIGYGGDYSFVYANEQELYWVLWFLCIVTTIACFLALKYPQNKDVKTNANENIMVADEIQKYKELLDNGLLTQEEFDAKKKQLLNL